MKIAPMIVLLILCTGCAKYPDRGGNGTPFCKVEPETECRSAPVPANPAMNFNKNAVIAEPHVLCVDREPGKGIDVNINLTPANQSEPNSVFVFLKKPSSGDWLIGSNSDTEDPDRIRIHVPESADGGNYDFIILDTGTGECLDPRWEVH